MAEPVTLEEKKPVVQATTLPPRAVPAAAVPAAAPGDGGRLIARVLRTGAASSGTLFLTTLLLEALPESATASMAIDVLRKAAASLLLVTPLARLVVAGGLLGLRGEWRYALYALGVLGLLGVAIGAGLTV